jgi:hypothetical protein
MSVRARLPNRCNSETFSFRWLGMSFTATVSRFDDGALAEIFLTNGKVNSQADTAARDSPPLSGCRYKAFVDPSGGSNDSLHAPWYGPVTNSRGSESFMKVTVAVSAIHVGILDKPGRLFAQPAISLRWVGDHREASGHPGRGSGRVLPAAAARS